MSNVLCIYYSRIKVRHYNYSNTIFKPKTKKQIQKVKNCDRYADFLTLKNIQR